MATQQQRTATPTLYSAVMTQNGLVAEQATEHVVAVRILPHGEGLDLPRRASVGSVGYDLRAAVADNLVLKTRVPLAVPCGIALTLPAFLEAQIRPRSGLALMHAVTCLNTPGTIDSDYRGEIKVILINHGAAPFVIERGMRIAQIVFARYELVCFVSRDTLEASARNCRGFGASGMRSLPDDAPR